MDLPQNRQTRLSSSLLDMKALGNRSLPHWGHRILSDNPNDDAMTFRREVFSVIFFAPPDLIIAVK